MPRGVVMLDHITQQKYSTIIYLIYVVKTLYFCRSITAFFVIFTAPLPHFLAKLLVRYRTFLHKKPHQTLVPVEQWGFQHNVANNNVYYFSLKTDAPLSTTFLL